MKKRLEKILIASLAFVAAIVLGGSAFAWGPERTTYTNANPATKVTFNSITDNAGIVDERNFVRVRKSGETEFSNEVDAYDITLGEKYEIYIYYHNNAASNLNLKATNTRVFAYFPGVIAGNATANAGAKISADNASPQSVWDEVKFRNTSDIGVTLKYVDGSAKIYTAENDAGERGAVNGMSLSEDLFKAGGTLIGYDALDGVLPGCAEYSGHIIYEVEVQQAEVMLSKQVSKDKENYYDNITNVKIGDKLYYKITVTNPGSKKIVRTVISDASVSGLTTGEAKLYAQGLDPITLSGFYDNSVGASAYALSVGGNGWWVEYEAEVTENVFPEGTECGEKVQTQLINTAYLDYEIEGGTGGSLANQAAVTVIKPCAETADRMPETGGDINSLIMSMLIGIAVTGGCVYIMCGIKMMHRRDTVEQTQQNNGENY